ncbi:MAG TPA: thiamine ABC transporter substrate-binding protein [Candidatus Methanofastidiosa archaeon]|mgnify:CR=1 FL=1|nr:thiamine ABC transporter substrate-binding protein [Candidatus Methanofastidiosa archaeon]
MKRIALSLILFIALFCGCISGEDEETELTIYAYDSFVADWGIGPIVIPLFEEKYGVKVNIISIGSSGDMISRAIAESDDPQADILLGINDLQMYMAFSNDLLESYRPEGYNSIPEALVMDDEWRLTPFDYGYMAIIYDSEVIMDPPTSFEDLKDPAWKDMLIVEDPRTSSPGLSFLLWTIAAYGDGFDKYWEEISDSILTVAPSWSTAYYGMFIEGEAPMVVSYSTSPAYHLEYEGTDRYKGVIFEEGGFLQIEGAGIVKGAKNSDLAKKFIDFMLSDEFQSEVALTQFMMPVNQDIELPDSYLQIVEVTDTLLPLDRSLLETELETWTDRWLEAIG